MAKRRNHTDVIDQLLEIIPNKEIDFIIELKSVKNECNIYTIESNIPWRKTLPLINEYIPEIPNKKWQYKVLSIFTGRSMDEIKKSIQTLYN